MLIKKRNWITFLRQLPEGIMYKLKRYLFLLKKREKQFTAIYCNGGFGGSPSRSGVGSNLENTENIRALLPKLIAKYSIRTFLDIPCGDMYWMRYVDLGSAVYIGGDIVEDLIKTNEQNFGSDKRSFKVIDICKDDLPCVDLIMCRDCLIHLKTKDILRALANIKRSGSKYLLVSTYPDCTYNRSTLGINFNRHVNLQIAPFTFDTPLEIIHDEKIESTEEGPTKCLALWRVKELPDII